jgi:hypothetical protein
MTDAELIAHLRALAKALGVAFTSMASGDTPKTKAAMRIAQEEVDCALSALEQRTAVEDDKKH